MQANRLLDIVIIRTDKTYQTCIYHQASYHYTGAYW